MSQFDYFVIFAEMRTGSNFLEANLNAFQGLQCHGEAFNPHFIGYPNSTDFRGVSHAQREANPQQLLDVIKTKSDGLGGFRFFNDHDPRVIDVVLNDPRCAKIILTRNPAESYVSLKIARATGQWKLTNVKNARSDQSYFDPADFEAHLEALQSFQVRLLNGLQRTGQTAFYVAYEDLQDVDVMNGLAQWLGCPDRVSGLDKKLKKQNPEPMDDKVINFTEMEATLARLDRFNLSRTPNFEPRRGPAFPTYIAAAKSPILYLPMRGSTDLAVRDWLARLDGVSTADLQTDFSQKTVRLWKKDRVGHRAFTVVRHPLARAHSAFCTHIRGDGPETYPELRETLRKMFKLPLPKDVTKSPLSKEEHREAFLAFLKFLKANLSAQTGVRVDLSWASQVAILQGFAGFASPDMILREHKLDTDLRLLAISAGVVDAPAYAAAPDPFGRLLSEIYDQEIEAACRDACQRDYIAFGYGDYA